MIKLSVMADLLKSRKLWLVLAAILVAIAIRHAGPQKYISVEALRDNRQELLLFVHSHFLLAAFAYLVVYAATATFGIPGCVLLTLTGGFLFGPKIGALLTVIGATIGATAIFLFARAIFGAHVLERFGPKGARLEEFIRRNAWAYLLALRITPIFPFFLVNLVAPLAGVGLRTYVITTFLGIIPGAAIFASYGAGLGNILDSGEPLSIKSILTPEIFAASIGLAVTILLAIPLSRCLRRAPGAQQAENDKSASAGQV